MTSNELLPVKVRELWMTAEEHGLAPDECYTRQHQYIAEDAATWFNALLLPGQSDIVESTLLEIAEWRGEHDLGAVRRRCEAAVAALGKHWRAREALAQRSFTARCPPGRAFLQYRR